MLISAHFLVKVGYEEGLNLMTQCFQGTEVHKTHFDGDADSRSVVALFNPWGSKVMENV